MTALHRSERNFTRELLAALSLEGKKKIRTAVLNRAAERAGERFRKERPDTPEAAEISLLFLRQPPAGICRRFLCALGACPEISFGPEADTEVRINIDPADAERLLSEGRSGMPRGLVCACAGAFSGKETE